MTASCYLCAEGGRPTLPGKRAGDAVGACKLCGVLACLGHGQRDPGQPAFVCGICLANLLAAASTKQVPTAPPTPPTPPPGGGEKREPAVGIAYAQWAAGINDPRDVIDDYDEHRWASVRHDADYLARALTGPVVPPELRMFDGAELEQARVLMGTAIAIATQLSLTFGEMIPPLRLLTEVFLPMRR